MKKLVYIKLKDVVADCLVILDECWDKLITGTETWDILVCSTDGFMHVEDVADTLHAVMEIPLEKIINLPLEEVGLDEVDPMFDGWNELLEAVLHREQFLRERVAENQEIMEPEHCIKAALIHGEIAATEDMDAFVFISYIGSLTLLCPSGKFYTPFANSNVERCPCCDGAGCKVCLHEGSIEAAEDKLWWDMNNELLEPWDAQLSLSEHCSTDVVSDFYMSYEDFLKYVPLLTLEDSMTTIRMKDENLEAMVEHDSALIRRAGLLYLEKMIEDKKREEEQGQKQEGHGNYMRTR